MAEAKALLPLGGGRSPPHPRKQWPQAGALRTFAIREERAGAARRGFARRAKLGAPMSP